MYDSLARYYDIVHSSLKVDLEHILQLAGKIGGPILELGCGTGRLMVPLARAGFAVTGVDNAPAMLAGARKRLDRESPDVRQRITLVRADVKRFSLPHAEGEIRLALVPYNTLHHFRADEIRQLLRASARYLHQEGRLFIDVTNPFVIEATPYAPEPSLENIYADQETGETIRQMSQSRLDAAEQCLHTTWTFDVAAGNVGDPVRTTIDFDYWYQYPHQLDLLLQQSGYRLVQMSGDYDASAFTETSPRLLITACPVPG